MRRFTVIWGLLLLVVVAVPLPAAAGPPTTHTFEFFSFGCELFGDGVDGFVSVFIEDEHSHADAAIWLGGDPFEREPDLVSDHEGSSASRDGSTVMATVPLVALGEDGEGEGENGEVVAVLTLDGLLGDVVGEETFEDRFRDGNRWVEISEVITFYDAEALVEIDGEPLEASCFADEGVFTETATNPHAYRINFADTFLNCFEIPAADGSTLNLFAGEHETEAHLFIEIFAPHENGGDGENGENGDHHDEMVPELFGETEISGLSGVIDVVVPLFDPFNGEGPIAEASVHMEISEGETTVNSIVAQGLKVRETHTELLITGEVDVSDGRSYELSNCFGQSFEAKGIANEASGPKTNGRPPSNDTVEGAISLSVGQSDNVQTKATATEPELACSETFVHEGEEHEGEEFEETFDLPIGKTVWYQTTGTGGTMTADTAGSNFDTIIGVYELVDGQLEQVICVDDVFDAGFSLQAAASWDSTSGATYYIQAGGFGHFQDPEFPEFSSEAQYGLLKLAITNG